jgi:L-ascorbate metabolism protein UlaG (beta-lactamase superfamily)
MLKITHVGAATNLLEIGGLRLLTDPSFDPPGESYSAIPLPGFRSTKTSAPALTPDQLGRIDGVLLTHDHHFDNLDRAGRALLPELGRVLTTKAGARRLGGETTGLAPWEHAELTAPDGTQVRVTATPARHGPPGSRPLVGDVIGFLLEWDGQQHGAFYISGDTVWFRGVAEVGKRHKISALLLHLGGARFPASGPIRYTPDTRHALPAIRALRPRTVIPTHMEGWSHFKEGESAARAALAAAAVDGEIRWLAPGAPTEIEV